MFLFYLCKDQNIIQVHHYNPFGYEGSEDVVHYSLEDGGTIGHSKEHYERLKKATVGMEGRFLFISGLDMYVIETSSDIKFCEVPGSAELGYEFKDERKEVSVLDNYGIQRMIVLDQPEQTIFLFNEKHRGCYGEFVRSDSSSTQVFL